MNNTQGNIKILVRIRGRDSAENNININTLESLGNLDRNTQNTRASPLNLNRNKSSNSTAKSTTLARSKSPTNISKNILIY